MYMYRKDSPLIGPSVPIFANDGYQNNERTHVRCRLIAELHMISSVKMGLEVNQDSGCKQVPDID